MMQAPDDVLRQAQDEAALPELLQRVREAAGEAVMLALIRAFGGTQIYLPQEVSEGSPLARAVGVEAGRRIVGALGHGHVTIPLGPLATHARVRKAIRQRLLAGQSVNRVAKAMGCHLETVKRERRRLKQSEMPPLLALLTGRR